MLRAKGMNAETGKNIGRLYSGVAGVMTGKEHVTCVYGSAVTNQNNHLSDIDFFVSAARFQRKNRANLSQFAADFHQQLGLGIDEEVPYENKIAIPYLELYSSARLHGLQIENGRVKIPQVVKSDEFLSSQKIRLRLVFNALTVPHDVNVALPAFQLAKARAEKSLFLLAADLADQRGLNPTNVNNLMNSLLGDGQGNEGETYLGYKPNEPVLKHLDQILRKELRNYSAIPSILVAEVLYSINTM